MAVDTQNAKELTQEQVLTTLLQPLTEQSKFLAAVPAANIHDTNGPLRIPRGFDPIDPDSLTWTPENGLIPEVTPEAGEAHLLPSTMSSVKVITRYSNEMARQSIVSLDAAIQSRLIEDTLAKIDAQLLGTGGDGITTPKGVGSWTVGQTVAVDGALDLDALLNAQLIASEANVNPDALTLIVNPRDYMGLRSAVDNEGRYMLQPDPTRGGFVVGPLGMALIVSPRVTQGTATVVDMTKVHVARDLLSSVKVLTERYADYDQQAIRVVTRVDSDLLYPEAAVRLTGLTAA